MGIDDKFQDAVGKAKEGIGKAVGDDDLRQEGQQDRVRGGLGQVADAVKEKATDAAGAVVDKVEDLKDKFTGK
ncbi:MAG: CsbD family protein [Propionibacteriaceae bacterium]|nr:CsbD family protein [Propionibacteriaceae bacterium]